MIHVSMFFFLWKDVLESGSNSIPDSQCQHDIRALYHHDDHFFGSLVLVLSYCCRRRRRYVED
jgi:hypothetical protein